MAKTKTGFKYIDPKKLNITLERETYGFIKQLVKAGYYPSIAAFFRMATRDLLEYEIHRHGMGSIEVDNE